MYIVLNERLFGKPQNLNQILIRTALRVCGTPPERAFLPNPNKQPWRYASFSKFQALDSSSLSSSPTSQASQASQVALDHPYCRPATEEEETVSNHLQHDHGKCSRLNSAQYCKLLNQLDRSGRIYLSIKRDIIKIGLAVSEKSVKKYASNIESFFLGVL